MGIYYVPEKGQYNEWEKIQLVKQTLDHINISFDKTIGYDELIKGKIEKLKKEYEARKEDESNIKKRRNEINILLKNELLTKNQRTNLINEFNEIGFKYFSNNDDELYEAIVIAYEMYIMHCFGCDNAISYMLERFYELIGEYFNMLICTSYEEYDPKLLKFHDRLKAATEITQGMIYANKILSKRIGFKPQQQSIIIAINAILLKFHDQIYNRTIIPLKEKMKKKYDVDITQQIEYLQKPHAQFINMYNLFCSCLVGVNVDEFIQCFPLEKRYQDDGCKNYFSSIETLQDIKSNKNFKGKYEMFVNYNRDLVSPRSVRWFLSEMQFTEPILLIIQLQMYHVIEYDTDLDSMELFEQWAYELQQGQSKDKKKNKDKLRVIK